MQPARPLSLDEPLRCLRVYVPSPARRLVEAGG